MISVIKKLFPVEKRPGFRICEMNDGTYRVDRLYCGYGRCAYLPFEYVGTKKEADKLINHFTVKRVLKEGMQ